MKKLKLLSALIILTICSSCNSNENTSKQAANQDIEYQQIATIPYKQETSEDGKARIVKKNGNPQLILSSLLRTDLLINADFMQPSEMEDYFAICKETGMNTIELSIMWSQIEKEYDQYNFEDIKYYLDYAKKYDLKVDIEWYGSFVDGETHSVNIPSYIYNNKKDYPIIQDMFDFANYGRCFIIDWNNPKLLERETKALYNMMNYIYDWNNNNDNYDPVVMVQIGQGIDRFQRWRIEAYKIKDNENNQYGTNEAWEMVQNYLNEVAKGVKYSKYKALTRVEFCEQNAVVNYVRNIEKLDNIDIVSPTYLHEIGSTKSGIKSFNDDFPDTAIINAENWANDYNYKQILATFAMGGTGYVSYQLSCPNYFPDSPNGALYNRYNEKGSTLAEKFVEKNNRATNTKNINNALLKAYSAVSNAKRSNFAAFGLNNLLNNKEGNERIQKIYLNCGILIEYSNPQDSYGFAIYDNNYLYAFSNKDATLKITNCTIPAASKGYLDEAEGWVNEGNVTLEDNNKLSMESNVIYRIRTSNIQSLPTISVLNEQEYKSTVDGIRG